MAFTVSVVGSGSQGSRRAVWGTFTSANGDSAVTISHGLAQLDDLNVILEGAMNPPQPKQVHSASSKNTVLTWDDTQAKSGRWRAIGL